MIASLLHACGLDLGPKEDLLPPAPNNPEGFWENRSFLRLNQAILTERGGSWNRLPQRAAAGWENEPSLHHLCNKAGELIRCFEGREPWGWKDPRNCLTLPLWRKLLPEMKVLVCVRNPLAVAESLRRRNGIPYADALDLWLRYNRCILAAAPVESRFVTHCESYLRHPHAELWRVLQWAGLAATEEQVNRACQRIVPSLMHHRRTPEDLAGTGVSADLRRCYQDLCAEAAQPAAGVPCLPRCVVLVPVGGAIDPECEGALRELERRGYVVWRVRGYAAIDAARNQMANDALAQGFDELMWIDSDIVFDPDDVDKLRRHDLPLACGIYPKKACRQFACAFLPDTSQVLFGIRGGVTEVLYCGFGFVHTRRLLYETLRQQLDLPVCNQRFQAPLLPYFTPLIAGQDEQAWLLGEDYSFCERARRCGFRIMADTTIRLWHAGSYHYGWEDAGRDVERYNDYSFQVTDTTPAAPSPPTPLPQGERGEKRTPLSPCGRGDGGEGMHLAPRNALHEAVRPSPDSFPRLRAYCFSYATNKHSLRLMLEDFRQSDWGEEPMVFMQPDDWPPGKASAARNYRRILEHTYEDGCDFALILEDDVRVTRHLRHNLTTLLLIRRDQCDYLSLFLPDLIEKPWQRQERHLGYRLAKPLYAGPNRLWERHRIWGSQAYVLSRRFLRAALERWDRLKEGQDARVLSICGELQLPLWYSCPCLVEHAPLTSAFATPAARAPDFDADFRLEIQPGFQPPEEVPGWLTVEEGRLLWEQAAGRRVLELGAGLGRSTVCLAQQARQVVTIDRLDQAEAREWCRRYQVHDRVIFHQGEVERIAPRLEERFDVVFVDTEQDESSVKRDIEAALPLLAGDGFLAFHDYPNPGCPAVRRVVDDYAARYGWRRVAQADFLGIFRTAGSLGFAKALSPHDAST